MNMNKMEPIIINTNLIRIRGDELMPNNDPDTLSQLEEDEVMDDE